MPLYVLVTDKPLKDTPAMERLTDAFGKTMRQVAHNAWVIRTRSQTTTISETVFPRDQDGNADMIHAVFLVGDSWGWHHKALWEWLNTAEKSDGE
jgi:hypothetical protein